MCKPMNTRGTHTASYFSLTLSPHLLRSTDADTDTDTLLQTQTLFWVEQTLFGSSSDSLLHSSFRTLERCRLRRLERKRVVTVIVRVSERNDIIQMLRSGTG